MCALSTCWLVRTNERLHVVMVPPPVRVWRSEKWAGRMVGSNERTIVCGHCVLALLVCGECEMGGDDGWFERTNDWMWEDGG